ncbi:type II secretion system GspH family protein [Patescibacteria group bacterium]|nr:type II secretion system GspH family protein [Patescibacteria group bacterium]
MKARGFTLIELLVVISIIGLLASIVLTSLNSARAKARDATRLVTLKELQKALELYASDHNGLYPASGWASICADSSVGQKTTSGANGYIPNLAPTYIGTLPVDPKGGSTCATSYGNAYIYTSNGTDYILISYATVETYTSSNNPMKRPFYSGSLAPCNNNTVYENDFALYTPGAQCW